MLVFCPGGVLSEEVLSEGVLSWCGFVQGRFVLVWFCPRAFCPVVLTEGVLSCCF